MKHANSQLAALTTLASDTIRTLLSDPNTPPSVRLRAAKLVLESAVEDAQPETPEPLQPKIGRNDYCPCGSGLKFKKCCLLKTQLPAVSVFDIPQAS